jgi:hypothetical protein
LTLTIKTAADFPADTAAPTRPAHLLHNLAQLPPGHAPGYPRTVTLLYCGVDEAGYGPLLGPLCVAATAFAIDDWQPGAEAPNLWKSLRPAVCRTIKGAGKRIPIADSKKLKLANDGPRDPLTHLERGVLAALHAWADPPACDASLYHCLGTRFSAEPWYAGEPTPRPRAIPAPSLRIDANMLRRAGTNAGVRLLGIWCIAICEHDYNALVREHNTKAATTALASRILIERILGQDWPGQIRIVCDRQGGRQHYAQSLSGLAGRGDATVLDETERLSRYALDERTRVSFMPEAEDAHLPVALASMTAKLVRELAMARFNAYWTRQMPGLKATAGYNTDARRWLDDARPILNGDTRSRLLRLA